MYDARVLAIIYVYGPSLAFIYGIITVLASLLNELHIILDTIRVLMPTVT